MLIQHFSLFFLFSGAENLFSFWPQLLHDFLWHFWKKFEPSRWEERGTPFGAFSFSLFDFSENLFLKIFCLHSGNARRRSRHQSFWVCEYYLAPLKVAIIALQMVGIFKCHTSHPIRPATAPLSLGQLRQGGKDSHQYHTGRPLIVFLQLHLPVVWYPKAGIYTENSGRRRASRSRTRAYDINWAATANNDTSSKRLGATHRESRNDDSESFRKGSICQSHGRKQFRSVMQSTLRTKDFSILENYKHFFFDHAGTLVQVPPQQPGTKKSLVRISRGMYKCARHGCVTLVDARGESLRPESADFRGSLFDSLLRGGTWPGELSGARV